MTLNLIALGDLILSEKVSFFKKTPKQNFTQIKNSIASEGLFNPLIVTPYKGKYLVLDGKKRLLALRKLARSSNFQRALHKIPCLIDVPESAKPKMDHPILISQPELAHKVLTALGEGATPVMVSQRFECAMPIVEDIMMLPYLNSEILMHFNNGTITLQQAAAFATIENKKAQLTLLMELGPFVSKSEIVSAIRSGEVVLDLPNGEVIILPSRRAATQTPIYGNLKLSKCHERLAA